MSPYEVSSWSPLQDPTQGFQEGWLLWTPVQWESMGVRAFLYVTGIAGGYPLVLHDKNQCIIQLRTIEYPHTTQCFFPLTNPEMERFQSLLCRGSGSNAVCRHNSVTSSNVGTFYCWVLCLFFVFIYSGLPYVDYDTWHTKILLYICLIYYMLQAINSSVTLLIRLTTIAVFFTKELRSY